MQMNNYAAVSMGSGDFVFYGLSRQKASLTDASSCRMVFKARVFVTCFGSIQHGTQTADILIISTKDGGNLAPVFCANILIYC